jgi:hypothetical protein
LHFGTIHHNYPTETGRNNHDIWRCASVATVPKTIDDLPEPETPVKIVIFRFGMRSETLF